MTPEAFREVCEKFKYPNAEFNFRHTFWGSGASWILQILINGVKDVFSGAEGPLVANEWISDVMLASFDETSAREFIRAKLRDGLIHEFDEQLQYGDDRPWYPHGPWAERKHLVVPPMPIVDSMMDALMRNTVDYYREMSDQMMKRTMEAVYEKQFANFDPGTESNSGRLEKRSGANGLHGQGAPERADDLSPRTGQEDREAAGREVIYESLSDSSNYAEPQAAEVAAQEDIRREPTG